MLELRDVHKSFGPVHAVAGVTERLGSGEYFCILGPSGCGKTTLLRLIAGFETLTSGEILLRGRSLEGVPPERRDVNVVFQSYALFPHMTVAENVAFGLEMKRLGRTEVAARVNDALAQVHLEAESGRYPRQLSGGQQQRVALARAVVNRPRVLLLDEPLSALDRELRVAMQRELRSLQRETGIAFLHITHDQGEALGLADRLAVMRAGRFVQVGPPREVYLRPATRFVAEFVGGANVLEGELVAEPGKQGALVRLADGVVLRTGDDTPAGPSAGAAGGAGEAAGHVVAAEHGISARASAGGDADGSVASRSRASEGPGRGIAISIRPEAIRVLDPAAAVGTDALRGTLRQVSFGGAATECVVEVAGRLLRVQLPGGEAAVSLPEEGREVAIRVSPADVVILRPDAAVR